MFSLPIHRARLLIACLLLLLICGYGCGSKAPEPTSPGETTPNITVPNANGKVASPERMQQGNAPAKGG
jgi:hypothetical protein